MALYYALKAFSFADAHHVNGFAFGEHVVHVQHVAEVYVALEAAELHHLLLRRSARLVKVPFQRARGALLFLIVEGQLYRVVAIGPIGMALTSITALSGRARRTLAVVSSGR